MGLRAPRAAGWWTHRPAPTAHSLDDADSEYSDCQNCSEAVHREQRLWARRSRSLGDVGSATLRYRRAAVLYCGGVRCCSCNSSRHSAIQMGVGSGVVAAAMAVGAAVAQELGTNVRGQPLACRWQAAWMEEAGRGCIPAGYRHVNERKGIYQPMQNVRRG